MDGVVDTGCTAEDRELLVVCTAVVELIADAVDTTELIPRC